VTLTNPSLESALPLRVRFANGARATEARASVLTHSDMRATNSFTDIEEVKPAKHLVRVVADGLELTVPTHAVVLVECAIA
jgi:alpha-L-arabinofuranosidase